MSAPYVTDGRLQTEQPASTSPGGAGSASCAVCHCTLALSAKGTVAPCPGCGGTQFLSVSMFGAETGPFGAGEVAAPAGEQGALARAEELRAARKELPHPGDYLLFRDGKLLRWIELTRAATRVGRSLVADLRFDGPTVSRRHALIIREPAGMRLLDDRSHYGVFVNGQRVDSRLLRDGDVISLGRDRLLYQRVATPSPRGSGGPLSALPAAPRPRRPR